MFLRWGSVQAGTRQLCRLPECEQEAQAGILVSDRLENHQHRGKGCVLFRSIEFQPAAYEANLDAGLIVDAVVKDCGIGSRGNEHDGEIATKLLAASFLDPSLQFGIWRIAPILLRPWLVETTFRGDVIEKTFGSSPLVRSMTEVNIHTSFVSFLFLIALETVGVFSEKLWALEDIADDFVVFGGQLAKVKMRSHILFFDSESCDVFGPKNLHRTLIFIPLLPPIE
jgi:hypothetical protein